MATKEAKKKADAKKVADKEAAEAERRKQAAIRFSAEAEKKKAEAERNANRKRETANPKKTAIERHIEEAATQNRWDEETTEKIAVKAKALFEFLGTQIDNETAAKTAVELAIDNNEIAGQMTGRAASESAGSGDDAARNGNDAAGNSEDERRDSDEDDRENYEEQDWTKVEQSNAKKHSPAKTNRKPVFLKKSIDSPRMSFLNDSDVAVMRKSPEEVKKESLARKVACSSRPLPENRFLGGPDAPAKDYRTHKRRFQESTNIDGMSSRAICEEKRKEQEEKRK